MMSIFDLYLFCVIICIESICRIQRPFIFFVMYYLCVCLFNLFSWGIFIYTNPGGGDFIVCIRATQIV